MKSIIFRSALTALFIFAGIQFSSAQEAVSTDKGKPAMQRSNDDASGMSVKPVNGAKTGKSKTTPAGESTLQLASPMPGKEIMGAGAKAEKPAVASPAAAAKTRPNEVKPTPAAEGLVR